MSIFRRNKVKFRSPIGYFDCLCDSSSSYPDVYFDGDIPGYPEQGLVRCWECGRVFSYPEGKFVAQKYTGAPRVDFDDFYDAHPELLGEAQAMIDADREANPEWYAMPYEQKLQWLVQRMAEQHGVDLDELRQSQQ